MCFSYLNRLWRENKYTQESSDLLLWWLDRSPMAWIIQWQLLPSPKLSVLSITLWMCITLIIFNASLKMYLSLFSLFFFFPFTMMQLSPCSPIPLLPNLYTSSIPPQESYRIALRQLSRRQSLMHQTWITTKASGHLCTPIEDLGALLSFVQKRGASDSDRIVLAHDSTCTQTLTQQVWYVQSVTSWLYALQYFSEPVWWPRHLNSLKQASPLSTWEKCPGKE